MAETIDRTVFEDLKTTAGAEFVKDLIDTFLVEAPVMMEDMRSALAAGDAERFRRAAHSLKSNSITFGAVNLAAMAKEIELGGLAPVRAAGGSPLDALEVEYTRVAKALMELKRA